MGSVANNTQIAFLPPDLFVCTEHMYLTPEGAEYLKFGCHDNNNSLRENEIGYKEKGNGIYKLLHSVMFIFSTI